MSPRIMLAAGGTGGHLFPAQALAEILIRRGYAISLITDARGLALPGGLDAVERCEISAANPSQGGMIARLAGLMALYRGKHEAAGLIATRRPVALVGFGGYPALPATLAAFAARLPVVLHEQNAVLGRVNRLAAGKATAIAVSWRDTLRLKPRWRAKAALTGNPVRGEVAAIGSSPYPMLAKDGVIRLLVLGGSQGASILSRVTPEAIQLLPPGMQRRLQVSQQCRAEDIDRVRAAYAEMKIPAELATFMTDVPERLRHAHLVLSRAGASSLAEYLAAGRPSLLVPLGIAMDDHQSANARILTQAGAAHSISEPEFTPVGLAKHLQRLFTQSDLLPGMAAAALRLAKPDAASTLADLVEYVIPAAARPERLETAS